MKPRLFILAALLVLLAAYFFVLECPRVDAVVESPVEKEAEDLLVRYLQIDTSNPPGNETPAANFLAELLRKEGIEPRLLGADPARQSVYARLSSGNSAPSLVLLSHLDVVPAKPGEWSVPPFSGRRSSGYIWGRGALDIKSLGIAQLMAFLDLKRRNASLTRDVIFLAVADEEAGGTYGARDILEKHPDLFANVGFVLNEGGANETIVDRVSIWGIEVDLKVPLWLRIVSRGRAGHGSAPPDDGGSSTSLVAALGQLQQISRPYRLTPEVQREFAIRGRQKRDRKGEILRDPARYFNDPEFAQVLPPSYRALLRDTLVITRLEAGSNVNSIPPEAIGEVDIRLLPDGSVDEMLARVRQAVGAHGEVIVLFKGEKSPASPIDTDLYRLLESVLRREEPGSVVAPMVSAGTTDSRFFRQRGIVAYGISPFKVNYYDADSVHGIDERIRAGFFSEGVRVMRQIVRQFCTTGEGAAKP